MKLIALLALIAPLVAYAPPSGAEPASLDAQVDQMVERLRTEKSADELMRLRARDVEAFLSEEERKALASDYLRFDVNAPAWVTVWRSAGQRDVPFWLEESGFAPAEKQLKRENTRYEAWEKAVDAGTVTLGYSALDGHDVHYFVTVRPASPDHEVRVSNVAPRKHTVGKLEEGARIYSDDPDSKLENIPDELEGQLLVRAPEDRADETAVTGFWRTTDYPSHVRPDQIVLTWSEDPTTTQTVQWRFYREITVGQLKYQRADGTGEEITLDATMTALEDKYLVNDPICNRFTATMRDLQPDTEYKYRVGTPDGNWSEDAVFRTAPAEAKPFRFVYMGDAQNGLDDWGNLMQKCMENHPDAHFYIMAGDLVNRGNDRDDWDLLFHNAEGIYDRRTLVPAIGNHEMNRIDAPTMYLDIFELPKNGSDAHEKERSYSFKYSNALFVVLDSNEHVAEQSAWLEAQLANTDAKWKFVVYHHPAYSSGTKRDNPIIRKEWATIFDKYHVDLALQGHDHAYLRTWPMFENKRVATPAEGTIYIVSVSGTKFYDQGDFEYTEFGMTKTSTFQVLDIKLDGDKLIYNAYDINGASRDSFVIEK